jgi:cupin superfamily acireductone dioxygenase involved in methionine salvage
MSSEPNERQAAAVPRRRNGHLGWVCCRSGEMIIIPTDAVHAFTTTGTSILRLTAIHENERAVTRFVDGTHRD